MLKGSIVALITPFKDDNLDENTYRSLIDYHLNNGTNGIVPGGTTGESPTLSHSEHKKIIEIAVKECSGKIPVIAGTGSNSTDEAATSYKLQATSYNSQADYRRKRSMPHMHTSEVDSSVVGATMTARGRAIWCVYEATACGLIAPSEGE